MKSLKKMGAFALSLMLCVSMLVSCGGDDKKSEEATKEASLSGNVKIVAAKGVPSDIVSKLPGDYKVSKVDDTVDVKEAVVDGEFDFAVLTPIEAAKLYNQKDNFRAVTTVSLGQWKLDATGYEGEEDPTLAYLSGKRIYALDEEDEMDEEEKSEQEESKAVAEGEEAEEASDAEEIEMQEPLEMSEEVLRALMNANGRTLYSNNLDWQEKDALKDIATASPVRILADNATLDAIEKDNKDLKELFDLNSLWQENFKSDIPGYILIVNKDFISKRGDEIQVVLDDMADSLEEAQKTTKAKLVCYNNSNRGISLIKKFNKVMQEHNNNAIGGEVPSDYYYTK